MHPTVSQYAEALEVLSEEGISTKDLTKNFLGFLKRRGESDKVGAVVAQLEKRAEAQSGKISVTVVTAHELEGEMREVLLQKAESIFPGKSVVLTYRVDGTVIGGARFETSEMLYDATVGAEFRALKKVICK